MKNILYTSLGILIGLLLILALFFFYHKPEIKKSYDRGYSDCYNSIKDSVEIIIPQPISHSVPAHAISGKASITKKDSIYEIDKLFTTDAKDSILVRGRSKDFNTELSIIDFRKSETLPGHIIQTVIKYLPGMETIDPNNYKVHDFQPFSFLLGSLSILIIETITLLIIFL